MDILTATSAPQLARLTRDWVIANGCYSPEENGRIYDKYFARGSRRHFRLLDGLYGVSGQVLCEAGCGYGSQLAYCAPGSYGLEIDKHAVQFAMSVGLPVHQRDLVEDGLADLPTVPVVWCTAVIEHVNAPHALLRGLHGLLSDGGLLILSAPVIPLFPVLDRLPRIGAYWRGHLAADHVNMFSAGTLRLMCEWAGFRTVAVFAPYPRPFLWLNRLPFGKALLPEVFYVGRKMAGWQYPEGATRRVQ